MFKPSQWQFALLLLAASVTSSRAQPFRLPTANGAFFEPDGEERFFVGMIGKPWLTGTFGCVRSDGWKFHEGIDIRSLQRDSRGEPTDPVTATADGWLVTDPWGTTLRLIAR